MEKYESSDGVATTEFKRLRNFVYTQRQEIEELKVVNEVLLSALKEGFNSGEDHDLDAWEDKTKALIKELSKGEVK